MTQRKGWCPGLFDPMPSGDGLLVRIKPPGGMLSADAARVLADAASRHGNGVIELTGRGNLQIRGLSSASVEPFAACIVACGLASLDAEIERRRNVIVSPLSGDDPSLAPETAAIAAAIERGLATEPGFAALPSKFGFLVDGGGVLPLGGGAADIIVRSDNTGFALSLDGDVLAAKVVPQQAGPGALRLAAAFLDLSASVPNAPRRMRDLIRAVGAEAVFRAGVEGRQKNQFVMAGLDPAIHDFRWTPWSLDARVNPPVAIPAASPPEPWPPPPGHDIGKLRPAAVHSPNTVGFLPYPGLPRGAFGLGLPFGQMEADMLLNLADLAGRFGDGIVRLTPWRSVLLGGIAEADAAQLATIARRAGMIVDSADPRRTIVACPGRPACASASVAARADAALLAAARIATGSVVHVSGCSKGCAHPAPAAFTLVGTGGSYGLVRNGTAAGTPEITGLSIAEAADLLRSGIAA